MGGIVETWLSSVAGSVGSAPLFRVCISSRAVRTKGFSIVSSYHHRDERYQLYVVQVIDARAGSRAVAAAAGVLPACGMRRHVGFRLQAAHLRACKGISGRWPVLCIRHTGECCTLASARSECCATRCWLRYIKCAQAPSQARGPAAWCTDGLGAAEQPQCRAVPGCSPPHGGLRNQKIQRTVTWQRQGIVRASQKGSCQEGRRRESEGPSGPM